MTKLAHAGLLAVLATLIVLTTTGLEATTRSLTRSVTAENLSDVTLKVGVGSIEVYVSEPATSEVVEIEVELKPRRGGIFSSLRKAQRQVDEAELLADVSRTRLRLEVDAGSDDHRFEERWTIHLPARLAMSIELGVGDAEIRGLEGGLNLEVGVGDVLIQAQGGDLELAIGVGDAAIKAPFAEYGEVLCSSGVGDARLRVDGRLVDSDGLVGHSATFSGEGPASLNVEVGVGDAAVTLE